MDISPPYCFGVSEFTTWNWSFEQDVRNYTKLGVNAIEICEFKLDDDHFEEQVAYAKSAGLTICSIQPKLHSLYPDEPRPDPKYPAERMSLFRRSIDRFGKIAPGSTLISITGAAPDGNYRAAFDTAVREYRALADYAADHGVRVALEPLNPILMNVDTFLCSLTEARRLVESVDRASFGLWVDVWHIWQYCDAEEQIKACGDRIFGVHVNDWHTPRHFGDRAIIGQGEIPLPKLLRAIHQTGYRGAYTLEIFSVDWLPDSLWQRDGVEVILDNKKGLDKAWEQANKD